MMLHQHVGSVWPGLNNDFTMHVFTVPEIFLFCVLRSVVVVVVVFFFIYLAASYRKLSHIRYKAQVAAFE